MAPTTSTTKTPPSEQHPGRPIVIARNPRARHHPARLIGIFDHPSRRRDGRRVAVVATPGSPLLRWLAILPGGRPEPPGGPAATLAARPAA
jgi:hypothetical protein